MSRVLMAMALILAACGSPPFPGAPVPGASCSPASWWPECITSGEVAFCEGGKWKEYACPGECRSAQSPFGRCDWSAASAGEACPRGFVAACTGPKQNAYCPDGKIVLENCPVGCRSGEGCN